MERSAIRDRIDVAEIPDFATLHPGTKCTYFAAGFGIRPLIFSMSLMFILMPPGIMMSPGFWSGLQAPSHFASIVVVAVARHAGRTALALRGGLDGVGGIEIADDLGMRRHRHAAEGADGIGDVAGRGLLDVVLRTDLLRRRRERRAHRLVGGLVGAVLHRHLGRRRAGPQHLHFPQARLAHRQFHRAGIGRGKATSRQAPKANETSCRVMLRTPG